MIKMEEKINQSVKIDKKDAALLRALDMNARLNLRRASKMCKIRRETTVYRLRRMTQHGVIAGATTFFNASRTGYSIYRVLLQLNDLEESFIENFRKRLEKHKKVMWLARVGGRWDFIVEFFARNSAEFDAILKSILSEFHSKISAYEVSSIIEIRCYPRKYAYGEGNAAEFVLGPAEQIELEEDERRVLQELKAHPLGRITEISGRLSLAPNTVRVKINSLKKKKVLLGFRLFIRPEKLGRQSHKIFFSFKNLDADSEKKFFGVAKECPEVVYAHKNFGKWNAEFEVDVQDTKKLQNIILETRKLFGANIQEYESMPIFHDYKISLYPDD